MTGAMTDVGPSRSARAVVGVLYALGLLAWLTALVVGMFAPHVSLRRPEADLATTDDRVAVQGAVVNAAGADAALTVNDAPVEGAILGGVVDTTIRLRPGPNQVALAASRWWFSDRVVRNVVVLPAIAIDTPSGRTETSEWFVTVSGTARNFDGATARLVVGDRTQFLRIREDGTFRATATLRQGANRIHAEMDVPGIAPVRSGAVDVACVKKPSNLWVELTWDQFGADLDLYVTQPDRQTSWFRDKATSAGGLDVDVQEGYGPEHYALSRLGGDRVPKGQYKIYVHYFRDHLRVGPVTYHLRVFKNETKVAEESGQLMLAAPNSAGPNRIGSDGSWTTRPVVVEITQ